LAEIAIRCPIGRSWLIDDRNRVEYRKFHDSDETRYRNRLRVEHALKVSHFRLTPYGTAEFFYPFEIDRWNEYQAAFGVDFPLRSNTVLEFETMAQVVDHELSSMSFAIVFQKYL
jgi:hypothetical protein